MIRRKKQLKSEECPLLTYGDIEECIDTINSQCSENSEGITKILNRFICIYM